MTKYNLNQGLFEAKPYSWTTTLKGLSLFFDKIKIFKLRNSLLFTVAAATKLHQFCLTLWDPIDSSPPGSAVPGVLQARTPEWVAISFSSAWKWKMKVKLLSCVWLFATPWTAVYQAPQYCLIFFFARLNMKAFGALNQIQALFQMCMHVQLLSHVWLSATPLTVASPSVSSVHRIFPTEILEWVAISFS